MNDLDKQILTAIQAGLPVEERPFDALAARLGVEAEAMVEHVRRLVADGLVRRLGPVFDSRSLGYVSTLVAARIPPARLTEAAERVSRLPGVTHNYERRAAYNLWFTLTAPSPAELEQTLETLRQEARVPHFHSLPALAVYKIHVHFDLTGDTSPAEEAPPVGPASGMTFSQEQKTLVRMLQDGLPAEREPLASIAASVGWPVGRVVEQMRAWIAQGVIRRFGAVVRHRELGFHANGMAVFRVPDDLVDAAGRRLAAFAEVSHCYRRPPLPDFPYHLYAMTHGESEDEVRRMAARMAAEIGGAGAGAPPHAYDVLFSVREFKKTSMRYFVE